VQVSSEARAEYLGTAKCSLRGSFFAPVRHATLLGDVLVVSRKPGTAEATLRIHGAEVEHDAFRVAVIDQSGTPIVRLRLAESKEAARWAEMLRAATAFSLTVPKMLSLTRVQLEQLKANQGSSGISEEQVRKLEEEIQEKENEMDLLVRELEGFKEVPKMLSLTRRQMAELEAASAAKEERIAQLQKELDGQVDEGMVTLSQQQVEELEAEAATKAAQVADLEQQVEGLQALPKQLSLNRRQVAELEAKAMQKDDQLAELQTQLGKMQDIPKLLSVKRREVCQLEAVAEEKEKHIAELKGQLDGFGEVAKMKELTDAQIQELQAATAKKEAEMEALKAQFTQELSKRPVRYVGIPVSTMVQPHSPVHRLPVAPVLGAGSPAGMTRWGASIQMVRQRTAAKVVRSPTKSVPPASIGA